MSTATAIFNPFLILFFCVTLSHSSSQWKDNNSFKGKNNQIATRTSHWEKENLLKGNSDRDVSFQWTQMFSFEEIKKQELLSKNFNNEINISASATPSTPSEIPPKAAEHSGRPGNFNWPNPSGTSHKGKTNTVKGKFPPLFGPERSSERSENNFDRTIFSRISPQWSDHYFNKGKLEAIAALKNLPEESENYVCALCRMLSQRGFPLDHIWSSESKTPPSAISGKTLLFRKIIQQVEETCGKKCGQIRIHGNDNDEHVKYYEGMHSEESDQLSDILRLQSHKFRAPRSLDTNSTSNSGVLPSTKGTQSSTTEPTEGEETSSATPTPQETEVSTMTTANSSPVEPTTPQTSTPGPTKSNAFDAVRYLKLWQEMVSMTQEMFAGEKNQTLSTMSDLTECMVAALWKELGLTSPTLQEKTCSPFSTALIQSFMSTAEEAIKDSDLDWFDLILNSLSELFDLPSNKEEEEEEEEEEDDDDENDKDYESSYSDLLDLFGR